MSTIVGHALAGLAVTAAVSRGDREPSKPSLAVVAVLAAVLPDIDVLFLLAGGGGSAAHRGLTHSLAAAIAVAAACAIGLPRSSRVPVRTAFLACLAAGLSHLLLDWAMGAGPPIRPFAPFSDAGYLAPARLVPTAFYARSAAGYASSAFWAANLVALAFEVVIVAPLIVAAQRGRPVRQRAMALTTSVLALVETFRLFN